MTTLGLLWGPFQVEARTKWPSWPSVWERFVLQTLYKILFISLYYSQARREESGGPVQLIIFHLLYENITEKSKNWPGIGGWTTPPQPSNPSILVKIWKLLIPLLVWPHLIFENSSTEGQGSIFIIIMVRALVIWPSLPLSLGMTAPTVKLHLYTRCAYCCWFIKTVTFNIVRNIIIIPVPLPFDA